MKNILLFLIAISFGSYADSYKEHSQKMTASEYYRYDSAANVSAVVNNEFNFNLQGIKFRVTYNEFEDLVILAKFNNETFKWSWVLVVDTVQLERDCIAENTGADCSAIAPFLDAFSDRATAILQRDYGGVVVIPSSWKEKLVFYIDNNLSFDESNIVLSFGS